MRSSVQASAVAVVSCPATSSVISSSRSSWSVSGAPSSSRAASSSERMSSRSSASGVGAALVRSRRSRSASASRGASCDEARPRARDRRRCGRRQRERSPAADADRRPSSGAAAPPGGRSRAGSSSPKTVRMMISSVIACIAGRTANGRPRGQRGDVALGDLAHRLARRSASARRGTAAASACGGACARRRRAAGASSRRASARAATLPSPACRMSGSPVKTSLTASGSPVTTIFAPPGSFSVNVSPWSRRHFSRNGSPRKKNCSAWTPAGPPGPGGRERRCPSEYMQPTRYPGIGGGFRRWERQIRRGRGVVFRGCALVGGWTPSRHPQPPAKRRWRSWPARCASG